MTLTNNAFAEHRSSIHDALVKASKSQTPVGTKVQEELANVFTGVEMAVVVYVGDSSKNVVRRYASALPSLKYEDCVALEKIIVDHFQRIQKKEAETTEAAVA